MTIEDKENTTRVAATIEEALDKTHFGKFNIYIILVCGIVMNNVFWESVGISFALPVVACDLNLSYQQQGVLGAVCFLGIIVSSHFWGLLADTRGRKRIMGPSLLLGFVMTLASSFSVDFNMIVILRFLNGIFISAGSATIFAYLGEFHSMKQRDRAILLGAVISSMNTILFPVIAGIFINQEWSWTVPLLGIVYKPWRLYLVVCGIPGFCCGLAMLFLPESPKYLLGVDRSSEALEVLKFVHRKNTEGNRKLKNDKFEITTLLPDLDTPVRKLNAADKHKSVSNLLKVIWDQTAPLFMTQHLRKTLLAALIQFIIFFTAHGIYMWFPHILNSIILYTDQYKEPKSVCDILRFTQSSNFSLNEATNQEKICITKLEMSTFKHTFVLELIYLALLLLILYATKKFNRTPILFSILSLCGVCGILSLVINIPLIAIYLFVVLLCCGLGTSVMNVIVVDIYPTNLRAMAVCISLMLGRIGSVAGSNILGALIESHCEEALYASAISLVIAGCLGFLMPKPNAKNNNKDMVEQGN